MLSMSHCCSCISDYVHCTEVIFYFNTRSLSIQQASAVHVPGLGLVSSRRSQLHHLLLWAVPSSQGAVPRHCQSQASQALGSSSWTQLQHLSCVCRFVPPWMFFCICSANGKSKD